MLENVRIKDLVEVPRVRTVVQLKDIQDENMRRLLSENFLITDEVARVLRSVIRSIVDKEGKGFFVEGNFGTGKSHLLTMLSQLFTDSSSWDYLLEQQTEVQDFLLQAREKIEQGSYLVLNISLVEHSHREYLEDIVVEALGEKLKEAGLEDFGYRGEEDFIRGMERILEQEHAQELQDFLEEKDLAREDLFCAEGLSFLEEFLERSNLPYRFKYDRQKLFNNLSHTLLEGGFSGVIVLIDELSEFLRSKPDGRRFNEDIRFLQFLGEFSSREPLWIVATLQEEIEKTGQTSPQAFNKIKDRYPTRFMLSGSHLQELITQRLRKLKSGAEEKVAEIYEYYRQAFPHLEVSQQEFLQLYPIHPRTIDLLENLKPLFSQHRGVVDFIHHRLRGDEGRDIEGMLEKSCLELLTPDKIFDHFTDRLREMVETSPYYEKVYGYYEQEISHLLPEEDEEAGLKAVKLLILFRISPIVRQYNVRDMANMLLYRVTDLDPAVNYEHLNDILSRLQTAGAYLALEKTGEGALDNCYRVDLEADISLIIKQKLAYIKDSLFPEDHRIFTRLGQLVNEGQLPLAELMEAGKTLRSVNWQNTERSGWLIFGAFQDTTSGELEEMVRELQKEEEDFVLFMGRPLQIEQERDYMKGNLLPEVPAGLAEAVAFWQPRELEERDLLLESLAYLLLLEEYQDDASTTGREIKERIEKHLKDYEERISRLFITAYFSGNIINGNGEVVMDPQEAGFVSFKNVLEKIVFRLLSKHFPNHVQIAPFHGYLSNSQLQELEEKFLQPGEISVADPGATGVVRTIESFLKPMDLIKRTGRNLRLQIQPQKNQLISELFSCLEQERTPLEEVYLQMRKGPYGLGNRQFKLLVTALIYSGYLTAYTEKQKLSLNNWSILNFSRIKYLGYGEIISEDFQEVLGQCPLIPKRFSNQPFSLPLQQEIWAYLTETKGDIIQRVESLELRIEELKQAGVIKPLNPDRMLGYLQKIRDLLEEIRVSYSAEEGLERFAARYRALPYADDYLNRLKQISRFFREYLEDYRRMQSYLKSPGFKIPSEGKYASLASFHQHLKEALGREELVYEEEGFEKLKEDFNEFRHKYQAFYGEEHEQQVGKERLQPYLEIQKSQAYKVLSLLAEIEYISVPDDLVRVNRLLGRALDRGCREEVNEYLQERPLCVCGFTLGEKVELPSLREIKETIGEGIREYLQALQEPERKEKIESYLQAMESAGDKKFARPVREILRLQKSSHLTGELEKRLNHSVIEKINRALAGQISLVERNLDQLYESLVERSFAPSQLKKIFSQWLEGVEGLPENAYVRVTAGDNKAGGVIKSGESGVFKEFLSQHYPGYLAFLQDLGLADFSLLLALTSWQKQYPLDDFARQLIVTIKKGREYEDDEQGMEELMEKLLSSEEHVPVLDTLRAGVEESLQERELLNPLQDLLYMESLKDIVEPMALEEFSYSLLEHFFRQLVKVVESSPGKTLTEEIKGVMGLLEQEFSWQPKKEILELTRYYLLLVTSLHGLEEADVPKDSHEWEKLYQGHLAWLELYLARLKSLGQKLDLREVLPLEVLEKRVQEKLFYYNRAFTEFFRFFEKKLLQRGDTSSLDLEKLLVKTRPRLLDSLRAENCFMILLDGMRLDVWGEVKKKILKSIFARVVKEGVLFAHSPTNTETQLELLEEASMDLPVLTLEDLEGEMSRAEKAIIRFNYVDDKVHTSREDYGALLDEILFLTEKRLIPFLERLPGSSPVLFFADHGFRINYKFSPRDKYETPRYLHGEQSPFEVMVPWALIYRA